MSSRPKWYENAYRRAVIDMHIPDWDRQFLADFDPEHYANVLLLSRAQSIVCYAQSHVGLFNYPTKVGRPHRVAAERNLLAEMIDACHRRDIAVVLYTSLIHDRYAADAHPDWRMADWKGQRDLSRRHGFVCPNSPYREYVRQFVEELCRDFQFEGIRFDMTFWPVVCYCDSCRKRFSEELNGEMPLTVDWLDPQWVAFQRARSRWLEEFASIATDTVKQLKPDVSVEHQSSSYPGNWRNGVAGGLVARNDFLQGDFYGDRFQGAFIRRLLGELSPNQPIGFETSCSLRLQDHTAMKPPGLLAAKAAAAIADGAAFVFIDAIDPAGTVDSRPHRRMGSVFDQLMPYYDHLGGDRVADVWGYYSFESKVDFRDNGRHLGSAWHNDSHTPCVTKAASHLLSRHVPYGVITESSLDRLSAAKVLILSNVNMMDRQECATIREWVSQGGRLYASGATSLVDKQGRRQADFILADVFGVSLQEATWLSRKRFVAPTKLGQELFRDFTSDYPAFLEEPGMRVKISETADLLATTTETWDDGNDNHFSSIHSDPPWRPTENPELIWHRFGKGICVYSAAPIEASDVFADTFSRIIDRLCPAYSIKVDGPACVEVTLFRQPDRDRYIISLVNFQEELLTRGMKNVPVSGMEIELNLAETVKRVTVVPSGEEIALKRLGRAVSFVAPRLDTLVMLAVDT